MSFSFKAIAKNPPGIFIISGAFLAVIGSTTGSLDLMNIGMFCLICGFLLQVLFLSGRRRF